MVLVEIKYLIKDACHRFLRAHQHEHVPEGPRRQRREREVGLVDVEDGEGHFVAKNVCDVINDGIAGGTVVKKNCGRPTDCSKYKVR